LVEGDTIAAVGPNLTAPQGARTIELPGQTLMPGMIEGHGHLFLHPYNETSWDDQVLHEPLALRTARAVASARATLLAGFTSERDLGTEGAGYADVGLKAAIDQGIVPGPRLNVATRAIVAPYQLDARRCISYLTIELRGSIPHELRPLIGNRIFGCDDCQLVCPWNKFAQRADEPDFRVRNNLDQATLAELFAWEEDEFLRRTEGSAIRRSGHERWLRNIAVALGNAPASEQNTGALRARREDSSALVREHVEWALAEHARRGAVG
jgi:hypothetical protein